MISFNPNLPPNDSLTPEEIEHKAYARGEVTRTLADKAYQIGGVPTNQANKAAKSYGNDRQDSVSKKARKDAKNWYEAKNRYIDPSKIPSQ